MNRIMYLLIGLMPMTLLPACGGEEPASMGIESGEGLYTCGMHPNVVQKGEGTCPICGMNLTPMKGNSVSSAPSGERKVKFWQGPMDPTFISDKPGKSPMGMDLVPVYEDQIASSNVVKIDPAVVQQVGVQIEPIERRPVFRHLRTIGEVEVGEDELSVVNLRFSGWVERLYVDKTGDPVKRGQVLFDIYSPELVAAQEELLLAIRTQGAESSLARSAYRKLELWDISKRDIDGIISSGKVRRTLAIRAPQAGFVLHKDLVEGGRVNVGKDVFRIGNLRRIWVTAEIYEHDAPWVEVGQPAQMELSYQPGEILEGQVAYIYPTLNNRSRTLSVRLEFENRGLRLKPGMFATVNIEFRRKDGVLAIPTEAILHSGRRQLVFVATGGGHFEPREVVTGLVGDRNTTEVLSGVEEGEMVVVSGQFLIDSESQLQEALRKMIAKASGEGKGDAKMKHPDTVYSCPMHTDVLSKEEGRCPKCGMDLEKRKGTADELKDVYSMTVAQPGQYTCPMHPEVISDTPGSCPTCGMFLEQVPEGEGDEHKDHKHMKMGGTE